MSKLKELRLSRNLTLKELAKRSKVSLMTLYLIERGIRKPSEKILIKLANVFEMSASELLSYLEGNNQSALKDFLK